MKNNEMKNIIITVGINFLCYLYTIICELFLHSYFFPVHIYYILFYYILFMLIKQLLNIFFISL